MPGLPRIGRRVFAPDSHEPATRELPRERLTPARVKVVKQALGVEVVEDSTRERIRAIVKAVQRRKQVKVQKYPRQRPCLKCDRRFTSTGRFHRLCDGCRNSNGNVADSLSSILA